MSGGKLKYSSLVIIISAFSCLVSNFGISQIIKLSAPILEMIYPVLIVVMSISVFSKQISNVNIYKGAAAFTFVVSIISVVDTLLPVSLGTELLPLAAYGFGWIVPAIIRGSMGAIFGGKTKVAKKKTIKA